VSAREWLYARLTGACIPGDRVSSELDDYRAEVLREAAADDVAADLGLPVECGLCLCTDCGGRLDAHTETSCSCEFCSTEPGLACSLAEFAPDGRIEFMAARLEPLLSTDRQRLAVTHAAFHAFQDYDVQEAGQ
jgi:hypothetical protein